MDLGDLMYLLVFVAAAAGPLLSKLKGKAGAGGSASSSTTPSLRAGPKAPPRAAANTTRQQPIKATTRRPQPPAQPTPPALGRPPAPTRTAAQPTARTSVKAEMHGAHATAASGLESEHPWAIDAGRRGPEWTSLQQAVVLQAMLDKPRALKPWDSQS